MVTLFMIIFAFRIYDFPRYYISLFKYTVISTLKQSREYNIITSTYGEHIGKIKVIVLHISDCKQTEIFRVGHL